MLFEKTAKDTKKTLFPPQKSPIRKKKCRRHGIPVTPHVSVGTARQCGDRTSVWGKKSEPQFLAVPTVK